MHPRVGLYRRGIPKEGHSIDGARTRMCILKAGCTQGGALYRRGYTQEGYSLDWVHSPICVGTPEKEYSKGGVHSMMCVFVYSKSGVHPRKSKLKIGFTLKIV